MKVQATKTMANEINNYFKTNNINFFADYLTMSTNEYYYYVSTDLDEIDYLPKSDKMRAIKICYPYEYFSLPRYLTTKELLKIYKISDKTFDGFFKTLLDEVQI